MAQKNHACARHFCRSWYNGSYTMMVKPKKTLELHYPMIQFLIKTSIPFFIKRLRKDGFINYKTKQLKLGNIRECFPILKTARVLEKI